MRAPYHTVAEGADGAAWIFDAGHASRASAELSAAACLARRDDVVRVLIVDTLNVRLAVVER